MRLTEGTAFPVATHSDFFQVIVAGQDGEARERFKTDKDSGVQRPNTSPDGRPTYSTGATLMMERTDPETGAVLIKQDKRHSINSVTPVELEFGTYYRAVGKIWVQPWINDGRQAFSITAESFEAIGE